MTQAERWLEERGWNYWHSNWMERSFDIDGFAGEIEIRGGHIQRFGFSILTDDVIDGLKEIVPTPTPILEIGAGTGYWSYELAQAGYDTVATDRSTGVYYVGSENNPTHEWHNQWGEVHEMSALEAIKAHGEGRALMTIWPDFGSWAGYALEAYAGDTLIFGGEGAGGCTGGVKLFDQIEAHWEKIGLVRLPQFVGINDWLTIYRRR